MSKYKHLTYEQRIRMEVLLKKRTKKKEIAEEINADRIPLYREINRNQQKPGRYNAKWAQQLSEERKEGCMSKRTFISPHPNPLLRRGRCAF